MTTRDELKASGEEIRHRIDAMGSDADTAPGYQRMVSEAVVRRSLGKGWPAVVGPLHMRIDRAYVEQNEAQLRRHIRGALKVGLSAREILEVFVQAGLYGGFNRRKRHEYRA